MIQAHAQLPERLRSACNISPTVRARTVESAIRRLYGRSARAGASPNRIGDNYWSVMAVRYGRHGSHVVGTMLYSEAR